MSLHPLIWLHKLTAALLPLLKLGALGVGLLALVDSALIPIPVSMDGIVITFVANNHKAFLLYSFVAALASAIGSLVPFYVGRAGGELFLLKRINRERYERIRDRFERQEFFAMLFPAMCPPPFPLKVFQFAAGVFEMRPVPFVAAIFCGKLVQFLVCSILTIWFGPALIHTFRRTVHQHLGIVIGVGLFGLLLLAFWVVRKIFDRKRGMPLPSEEPEAGG